MEQMSSKAILLILFSVIFSATIIGQEKLTGKVVSVEGEPLFGAHVYWSNSENGVITSENGDFSIDFNESDRYIVTSYIGYETDTIEVLSPNFLEIKLQESNAIAAVEVKGRREGIVVSNLNPIKTEQVNALELKKSACCDLAGCFQTQATVQPHTTNVITNSKELRILGLSGVYNQVLINGLPMIQGLSYTYGISSFPGTIVNDIFISKGANSVLQGFESISGQINVKTKTGDNADRLLVNLYINSFLEKHVNVNYAVQKGYWSNLLSLHTVQPSGRFDRDEDTFLDLPLLTRYSVSNTWKYRDAGEWGWNSIIGVRLLSERRIGGQLDFNFDEDLGSSEVYGQAIRYQQPELWTKTGYRFDDFHNISFNASAFYQDQDSDFGLLNYQANQFNFYANAQYEYNYETHDLKTGLSFRYQDLRENIDLSKDVLNRSFGGAYTRNDIIPGIFAENTMKFFDDRLTWIGGARLDFHQEHGSFFTPRTLIKYDLSSQSVLRANIGTGWRVANVFSENINLLASSRDIIFDETLEPEQALNYGINYIQKFDRKNLSGYVSADFYHTEFQNQIFPDFDKDPQLAIIKNFYGTSIANGFQLEANASLFDWMKLKVGYNHLDVYRVNGEEKEVLPFNSRNRWMGSFSYRPVSGRFFVDINAHWFGKQRLPNTSANPLEFRRPEYSEPYTLVNMQVSYELDKIEWYAGCENIFDFRQRRPIISWQDPFSPFFDTNSVWGPTRGREFYVGVRYKMREE